MPVCVCITLLSGKMADIEVEPGSRISDLIDLAEVQLGMRGRLINGTGIVLGKDLTIGAVGLKSGDVFLGR